VSQHAIPLETPEQAVRFNHRLVNACIRADAQPGPVRPGQLHVVIVGAGATGTELAPIGPRARLSPLGSTASILKEIFTSL
jgi:NADH dehydrogenase FAD-containing subunit